MSKSFFTGVLIFFEFWTQFRYNGRCYFSRFRSTATCSHVLMPQYDHFVILEEACQPLATPKMTKGPYGYNTDAFVPQAMLQVSKAMLQVPQGMLHEIVNKAKICSAKLEIGRSLSMLNWTDIITFTVACIQCFQISCAYSWEPLAAFYRAFWCIVASFQF